MTLPDKLLLTDLLRHRVRCDQGIDHGIGVSCWMHPPVHRVLGWASKPSALKLSRDIWKLNQLRGVADQEVFVKGKPSISDQVTFERIPTLFEANIFNIKGERLGLIADIAFETNTGVILYYLISRSDPRIPGTSRWRLMINKIIDQQPGMVSTNLVSLDDIPISKASLKYDLFRKSKKLRNQFNELADRASSRLEGWLDDRPFEQIDPLSKESNFSYESDPLDGWENDDDFLDSDGRLRDTTRFSGDISTDDDPWV